MPTRDCFYRRLARRTDSASESPFLPTKYLSKEATKRPALDRGTLDSRNDADPGVVWCSEGAGMDALFRCLLCYAVEIRYTTGLSNRSFPIRISLHHVDFLAKNRICQRRLTYPRLQLLHGFSDVGTRLYQRSGFPIGFLGPSPNR
jgi:hypothetical protein